MRLIASVVAMVVLSACGGKPADSGACAGVSVDGVQKWTAEDPSVPVCVELADKYQAADLDIGSALDVNTQECTAGFDTDQDGVQMTATCDVSLDGGADCDVRVKANGSDCKLRLEVTP